MTLRNKSVFVGELITIGRRTGLPRTVEIRLVYLDGKFYATSSNIQGKHWCQNMIQSPKVEIKAVGKRLSCRSQMVTDDRLRSQVLHLRDSPALQDRVVFEISPIGE
jgi:hypothetical protein